MIYPFVAEQVRDNQPWLTDELAEQIIEYDERLAGSPLAGLLQHFILTPDMRIVEEPNLIRWSIFMEMAPYRFIDRTVIREGKYERHSLMSACWVSTAFLGTTRSELFETMIFGGPMNNVRWKTEILGDAKMQHADAVYKARESMNYLSRRRHGRTAVKAYKRAERFNRLIMKRDEQWARKNLGTLIRSRATGMKIPGRPNWPSPFLMESLFALFVARTPTVGRTRDS